jgi:pimeloyl-ACP methyl ester carboxylesterase
MHKKIKNSRLFVIQSAKHLSNIEQPEIFNSSLLKFLSEVEERSFKGGER